MKRFLLVLALIATAASCGNDPAGPDEASAITTDAGSYVLRPGPLGLTAEIAFVFRNRSSGTVYVVNCNGAAPPVLQRRVDGEWLDAWAPAVPACLSPPILIDAGDTYGDVLRVRVDGRGDSLLDMDLNNVDGTYRLLWPGVLSSYDETQEGLGTALPVAERTSNEFTMRRG